MENGISDDGLNEDVSEIVYRIDMFECGDIPIINRHIDIGYSFGGYYEVHEDSPLFQFVDGVWPDYDSEYAFTNRLVVQPFADETFRYLSNSLEQKKLEIPKAEK